MAKLNLCKEDVIRSKEFAENYYDHYVNAEVWRLYSDWLNMYDENEKMRKLLGEIMLNSQRYLMTQDTIDKISDMIGGQDGKC